MSQSRSNVFAFSREQLQELKKLGVTDKQMEELRAVLPSCAAALMAPPTLTELTDKLSDFAKWLEKGRKLLDGVANSAPGTASFEVNNRLAIASFGLGGTNQEVANALVAIANLIPVIEAADRDLPKVERRHRKASYAPIEFIESALIRGWAKSHPDALPVQYHLPVSSSPTSPFRRIAGVCYDAFLGSGDNDPESAIRNFISIRKGSRQQTRKKVVSGKAGAKKSELPS